MRKSLYLIVFILVFGCNQTSTKQQRPDMLKESKFKNLLTKYKTISFDTLKVFSVEDVENDTYKFKGTHLDSNDVKLFPAPLSEQYVIDNGYFACYKFSIDSNRTGLLTRTPSTYEPTSIKLLIFDKQEDVITDFVELAETVGDAGDIVEKIAWLFTDDNKKYKSFVWVKESHDNTVDDEKDTTVRMWNSYCLLDISKTQVDTVSKNEKDLLRKFGAVIRQEASR
jgi:hypothetical protein